MAKKLEENRFDMDDLLEQLRQIQKMGSLKSIIGMLPGVGSKLKDADIDDRQFVRIEAMITSMTKAERAKPSIINPSRKRRIAAGSGTKVEDVNRLLKQFDQMQKMMKQLGGKAGKGGKMNRRAMKRLANMAVKIRLRRMGAKKAPFYRIVVADERYPRDGRFIEEIGYYDPTKEPTVVNLDADKAKTWLKNGAQPTDTVKVILKKEGVL